MSHTRYDADWADNVVKLAVAKVARPRPWLCWLWHSWAIGWLGRETVATKLPGGSTFRMSGEHEFRMRRCLRCNAEQWHRKLWLDSLWRRAVRPKWASEVLP